MSTAVIKDDRKKKLVLRPSSRTVSVSGLTHTRLTGSRRSFSLGAGSKVLDKSTVPTPRQNVRVFDEEENDVTPQPLHQAESGAAPAKGSRFFLDEISAGLSMEQMTTTGSSFSLPLSRSILSSSKFSSQSSIDSANLETQEAFFRRDLTIHLPEVQAKKASVKEEVTEQMLDELIDVHLSETDTFSLLDLPPRFVSTKAENAQAVIERNKQYAEVCKSRAGNEKYVDRSVQTLNAALKHKQVQSDSINMADTGTFVSTWEMYDTLSGPEQEETLHKTGVDQAEISEGVLTSSQAERSIVQGSSSGTGSATSSMKDLEIFENSVTESDLQSVLTTESFQQSLLVMERSLVANSYQPKLALYRQLPVLQDPDASLMSEHMEQENQDSGVCPELVHLWSFTCELTQGRRVNSMSWNKRNPDLLAVGYGESDSSPKPGLVCCWSLKNPTWPERVVYCDSAVMALDFSANSPTQLAVGMLNGTVTICNVQIPNSSSGVLSSSNCPNKHLEPVLQLRWTLQEVSLRDDKEETLISVAADGRICKWFVSKSGLDCTDMMKLKRMKSAKNMTGNGTETKQENILSALTPGLCFDFHPAESGIYLVGTWEGLIHKCSCSNTQHFMDTYNKHFCPVSCVSWSPLSPDLFLSCSPDWTVQLWKQDRFVPALSFTSTQRAALDVKWSPKWATVFGSVRDGQLEIWDLNHSILDPVIVQPSAPSVKMTSLLFTSNTDCVVVGDSVGEVTVYLLKNMNIDKGNQVDVLEDIIRSAASR